VLNPDYRKEIDKFRFNWRGIATDFGMIIGGAASWAFTGGAAQAGNVGGLGSAAAKAMFCA
jgi:hypothetical protein